MTITIVKANSIWYTIENKREQQEVYMMANAATDYECDVCGYLYDPQEGDPENGVDPGTPFTELPYEWLCPICGAEQSEFHPVE